MSFTTLEYSKNWTSADDFPTREDSETKVRADLQLLHDEAKAGVNRLIAELTAPDAAQSIGIQPPETMTAGTVQTAIEELAEKIVGVVTQGVTQGAVSLAMLSPALQETLQGLGSTALSQEERLADVEAELPVLQTRAETVADSANGAIHYKLRTSAASQPCRRIIGMDSFTTGNYAAYAAAGGSVYAVTLTAEACALHTFSLLTGSETVTPLTGDVPAYYNATTPAIQWTDGEVALVQLYGTLSGTTAYGYYLLQMESGLLRYLCAGSCEVLGVAVTDAAVTVGYLAGTENKLVSFTRETLAPLCAATTVRTGGTEDYLVGGYNGQAVYIQNSAGTFTVLFYDPTDFSVLQSKTVNLSYAAGNLTALTKRCADRIYGTVLAGSGQYQFCAIDLATLTAVLGDTVNYAAQPYHTAADAVYYLAGNKLWKVEKGAMTIESFLTLGANVDTRYACFSMQPMYAPALLAGGEILLSGYLYDTATGASKALDCGKSFTLIGNSGDTLVGYCGSDWYELDPAVVQLLGAVPAQ